MFDVGDKVVYPHHGAAVVEKREVREAFGEKREYLVLRLAYGDLTLMVPADNTGDVQSSLAQAQDMNIYYLQIQEEVNAQNRSFTALSNVIKAEHDTVKTAIGNIH